MPRVCKICKSWSFSLLVEVFEHLIPSLNKYNLSNHFAKHVHEKDITIYEEMKKENVL